MGKFETLLEVFEDSLKDIYSAETQLIVALPKLIQKASTPPLKEALTDHLEETKLQVKRLDEI